MIGNSAAVYMINKMGSSHTETGNDLGLGGTWEVCISNKIWLTLSL